MAGLPKPLAASLETARDAALEVCGVFLHSYPVLYSPLTIDKVEEIIERYAMSQRGDCVRREIAGMRQKSST